LQSAGNLVTREELRSSSGRPDTFVDFDQPAQRDRRIREVLGDSADAPKYIETLPGADTLYCAVEEVQAPWMELERAKRVTQTRLRGARSRLRLPRHLVACLALACNLDDVAALYTKSAAPVIARWQFFRCRIFRDPAQEYFADGMTEELITELSRITPSRSSPALPS